MGPGVHIDPLLAREVDEELARHRLSDAGTAPRWPVAGRRCASLSFPDLQNAEDLRCTAHPVPKGPDGSA